MPTCRLLLLVALLPACALEPLAGPALVVGGTSLVLTGRTPVDHAASWSQGGTCSPALELRQSGCARRRSRRAPPLSARGPLGVIDCWTAPPPAPDAASDPVAWLDDVVGAAGIPARGDAATPGARTRSPGYDAPGPRTPRPAPPTGAQEQRPRTPPPPATRAGCGSCARRRRRRPTVSANASHPRPRLPRMMPEAGSDRRTAPARVPPSRSRACQPARSARSHRPAADRSVMPASATSIPASPPPSSR